MIRRLIILFNLLYQPTDKQQVMRWCLRKEGLTDSVTSIAIRYDSTRLVTGYSKGSLGLWSLENGQIISLFSGQDVNYATPLLLKVPITFQLTIIRRFLQFIFGYFLIQLLYSNSDSSFSSPQNLIWWFSVILEVQFSRYGFEKGPNHLNQFAFSLEGITDSVRYAVYISLLF